jgi:hypothetical protein
MRQQNEVWAAAAICRNMYSLMAPRWIVRLCDGARLKFGWLLDSSHLQKHVRDAKHNGAPLDAFRMWVQSHGLL